MARLKGEPVDIVYPDSGEDELGTMLIPNTVAMIEGAPNPEAAKKLIDFIESNLVLLWDALLRLYDHLRC